MALNEAKQKIPYLSICIPTYNRASYLEKSLSSIVNTSVFIDSNDIEIVVSDNDSSDNTFDIMENILKQFPNKIKYNKNLENLRDQNFEIVLTMASGRYRKLSNDNILYTENALTHILKVIKTYEQEKPLLFFSNGSARHPHTVVTTHTISDFIEKVSFYSTWIGAFGLWDSQIWLINKFSVYCHTQLIQVKLIYEILKDSQEAVIDNNILMEMFPIHNKSSYDIFKVFGYNYINILQEYLSGITLDSFKREKRRVLFGHIVPYFLNMDGARVKCKECEWKALFITYKKDRYFYYIPIIALLYFVAARTRTIFPPALRKYVRENIMK